MENSTAVDQFQWIMFQLGQTLTKCTKDCNKMLSHKSLRIISWTKIKIKDICKNLSSSKWAEAKTNKNCPVAANSWLMTEQVAQINLLLMIVQVLAVSSWWMIEVVDQISLQSMIDPVRAANSWSMIALEAPATSWSTKLEAPIISD